jgi:extracellular elastinolytic metalloproteinase
MRCAIHSNGGWLTGPRAGDPVPMGQQFIDANRTALGLSPADVAGLAVVRNHELVGTGTSSTSRSPMAGCRRPAAGTTASRSPAAAGSSRTMATPPQRQAPRRRRLSTAHALATGAGTPAPGVSYIATAAPQCRSRLPRPTLSDARGTTRCDE